MRKRGASFKPRHGKGGVLLLAKCQDAQTLSRPLSGQDEVALLVPARLSMTNLMDGVARTEDLHAITALLNVGMLLAHDIGEHPARDAIELGVRSMKEVSARPGPRYGVNSSQREAISQAVQTTDDLYGVSSLLEVTAAHRRVLSVYDRLGGSGNLEPVEI